VHRLAVGAGDNDRIAKRVTDKDHAPAASTAVRRGRSQLVQSQYGAVDDDGGIASEHAVAESFRYATDTGGTTGALYTRRPTPSTTTGERAGRSEAVQRRRSGDASRSTEPLDDGRDESPERRQYDQLDVERRTTELRRAYDDSRPRGQSTSRHDEPREMVTELQDDRPVQPRRLLFRFVPRGRTVNTRQSAR